MLPGAFLGLGDPLSSTRMTNRAARHVLLDRFVEYLRTFRAHPELFAPDVACTYYVPGGHYVKRGPSALEDELQSQAERADVEVKGAEVTPLGFLVEFTQRTPRGDLYEEMVWARVENGRVKVISSYCTGVVREG